jgi:formate dehydrogenase assembly factor FdhD
MLRALSGQSACGRCDQFMGSMVEDRNPLPIAKAKWRSEKIRALPRRLA